MRRLALLVLLAPVLWASYPSSVTVNNAGSTGTTLDTLTSLTGAPSTAVITSAGATSGVVGITIANPGTTGNATIQTNGLVLCVFDGATTANHYVGISSGTAGDCTDAGASFPTSGQVIGRVLTTNGGAGTYIINLFPSEVRGSSGSSGTVTSASFTGGLISVGTPTTTPAFTVAGASGGIPYFASSSTWASSGALGAGFFVLGGGAGSSPTASNAALCSSGNCGFTSTGATPDALSFASSSTGGAASVAPLTGTLFHGVAANTVIALYGLDAYAAATQFAGRRADGTIGSPATIAGANESLMTFDGYGYNGSAYILAARIIHRSSQAYTGSVNGTETVFAQTKNGATGATTNWQMDNAGNLNAIGASAQVVNVPAHVSGGGTKFTTTGCSVSATTGGSTAGTITSGAASCTIVITMNGATGLTAPNGWACYAADITTPADTMKQSATSTTTCTITGTTVIGDVIVFGAIGY